MNGCQLARLCLALQLCIGLTAFSLKGQNQVRGFVINEKTQVGIEGVSIIDRLSGKGTISGSDGYFTLQVQTFPVILNFSHLAYERNFRTVEKYSDERMQVALTPKNIQLDEVMITAKPYIDLTRDKPLYVRDFDFVGNKILMLANRDIKLTKPELIVAELNGKELYNLKLLRPEGIVKDCFGQIHVLNYFNAYQVGYYQDSLFLMDPIPRETYHAWMDKAYLSIGDSLVLRQFDEGGQELTYSMAHESWSQFQELRTITNQKTVDDYRYWSDFITSELYDYLIMQSSDILDSLDFNYLGVGTGALTGGSHIMATSGDPTKPSGHRDFGGAKDKLNLLRHTVYHQIYMGRVNFVDVYAPLFKAGNRLVIFNCVDDQLEVMDLQGRLRFLKPIDFHLNNRWVKRIIQDPVSERFYTLYSYGFEKTLKEISIEDGEIIKSIDLPKFPHMSNFKIYNGTLYFLYTKKMGGIEEPTHLYKIPLNL
jgi:hypothetical protein